MKAIIAGLGLTLLTTVYAQNQYIEELHAARDHLEKILTNGNVGQQYLNVISNYASLNSGGELDQLLLTVSDEKSDIWYTSTENVVGKYYIKNVDGVSVYEEVPVDYVAPEGVQIFDVYESSPWLFCRYDDNVGGTVTTVRSNYMPVFRDLISLIPFQDWIYDSVEGVYTASFTRSYSLGVTFKVVDTDGNVGYTTDDMTVTLN